MGIKSSFEEYANDWFMKLTRVNHKKISYLLSLQAHCCYYCKKTISINGNVPKKNRATIEHKKLQSAGGTFSLNNIVVACQQCNNLRNDMDFEKFNGMMKTLGFEGTRDVIYKERASFREESIKRKIAKKQSREKIRVLWLAYLLLILDKQGVTWYPTSTLEAA